MGPETNNSNSDFRQEYLELTKKQTTSGSWSEQDRMRLLELNQIFNIDQPLTQNQKDALHRQGLADTPLRTGEKPQPHLTRDEVDRILKVNEDILKSHRG